MTPKEKAKYLIEKYKTKVSGHSAIKQCALIAVDEIIVAVDWNEYKYPDMVLEYWEKVKQEINNI